MEIRLPLIVDDVDYKLKDGMQTTEGVERYDFVTPEGHLYEIDLAPANAADLEKAVKARDDALAQINAEYEEAIADYLRAGQRMAPGARKVIKGAKRAVPAAYVSPATPPALPAAKPPRKGYLSIPDKAGKVACRAWVKQWAGKMGWGTIGDYGVMATAHVDAWTEAGSPTDVNVPPMGLSEPAPKAPRKATKTAAKALPAGGPATLFQAAG